VRSREAREGTFLGEVSTLTGLARTASIVAEGRVHVAVLNAAELDELVLRHPAVATRLLRALAQRVAEAYALGPGGAGGR
jgi:CRP-like cAMP-binding protein